VKYASINGTIIEHSQATIHISDLGLRRGYGAFEFFRILRGIPVFLEDHLGRFEQSAEILELKIPVNRTQLQNLIADLIGLNELKDAGIQIVLTGGYSPDAFTPGQPNLIMAPVALKAHPALYYQQGAKIILHPNQRELPLAKTTDYLVAVKLSKRVRAEGATEVVYHDGRLVSEGGRSSLSIIKSGILITDLGSVLPGITRMNMLRVAEGILPIQHRSITLEELFDADEVILTGATREIMPITQIEDRPVADGKVGPFAQTLMKAFREHLEAYLASRMVAL
jgi:D-alanine transaminase/branched-chain amino acid aminotransferase